MGVGMERLETKRINGRTYYYYSKWGWKDGKCRRLWQKYLGSLEHIVETMTGGGPSPRTAEVFEWGLPMAFWKECTRAHFIHEVDKLCPKRRQGLSIGQYLAIAAINRGVSPCSKRSIWEWFAQTAWLREMPEVGAAALSSQRFWDHRQTKSMNPRQLPSGEYSFRVLSGARRSTYPRCPLPGPISIPSLIPSMPAVKLPDAVKTSKAEPICAK